MSQWRVVHCAVSLAVVLLFAAPVLAQGGAGNPDQQPEDGDVGTLADECLESCEPGPSYSVSVTPDGNTAAAVSPYGSGYTLVFRVRNTGSADASLNFSCAVESTVNCTGVSPFRKTVASGSYVDVTVTYEPVAEIGTERLYLEATGDAYDFGYYFIPLHDDRTAPLADTTPHNGENVDVSRCVLDCMHAVLSYSAPAYVSLDTPRSVALLYRSEQARPNPLVQVQVTDTSADAPDLFSIGLRRWDGQMQTLRNGNTEVYHTRHSSGTNRLAAQFDASGLATGAYRFEAIIRSHWTDVGVARERVTPVTVLVVNEQSSSFGLGWSMPGLQRVHRYDNEGVSGVVVTEGDGSALFFSGSCAFSTTNCTFVAPAGDFSTLTWSGSASTLTRRYPGGTTASFHGDGRLAYVQDRFGNRTTYNWDTSGRLESIADPVGLYTVFTYGSDGRLDWLKTPDGRRSNLTISSGRVTAVQDPSTGYPLQNITYDSSNRLTSWQDRRGAQWNIVYDAASRVASVTAPTVEIDGNAANTARPVTTYSSGDTRLWQSSSGTSGTYGSPRAARTASDWSHQITTPRSVTTLHYLDRWQQPVRTRVAHGTSLARESWSSYDSNGLLTRSVDPLGRVRRNTWNGHLLTQTVDSSTGRTVNTAYDAARYYGVTRVWGDVTEVDNTLSTLGLVTSTMRNNDADVRSSFTYDSRGRILTSTDPEDHVTTRAYESSGFWNTASVTNSRGETTSYRYDSYGRTRHVVTPLNDTVSTYYDVLNRDTLTVAPVGLLGTAATRKQYLDVAGQVVITDAIGQAYTYQYDALGRLQWEQDPLDQYLYYGYDLVGNQTYFRNRRGQTVTAAFDTLSRVLARTADSRTTYFRYYGVADSTVAWNAHETVRVRLDDLGRPDSVTFVRGTHSHHLGYDYDPVEGQLEFVRFRPHVGSVRTTSYQWNAFRQVHVSGADTVDYNDDRQTTALTVSTDGHQLALTRTADHLLTDVEFFTDIGQFEPTLTYELGRRYTRDRLGRIDGRYHSRTDSTAGGTAFEYDRAGRISSATRVKCTGASAWVWNDTTGYNCSNIEPTILTTAYSWDAVGNPTYGSAVVTDGNRLTSMNGYSFEYDADGNITRKYGNGLDRRYYWNALGQLDSVYAAGSGTVRFRYGPSGNRIQRTGSNGTVTHYVYDRGNLAAELDASGAPIRVFSYYPGLDAPRTVEIGGATYHYIRESPNHVVGLVDPFGNVVRTYHYDAFGQDAGGIGTLEQPLRYGARELDTEVGLYYNRARWYDPEIGRFISEDPIRLAGGINLYAYTGGNPVNATDPSGTRMLYIAPTRVTQVDICHNIER